MTHFGNISREFLLDPKLWPKLVYESFFMTHKCPFRDIDRFRIGGTGFEP